MSISTMSMLIGVMAIAPPITDILINSAKRNSIRTPSHLSSLSGEGLRISQNVRISIPLSNEHLLVVFPSGEGKTRRIIIPNVKKLQNCSIIVTDPNGEVEQECDRPDMEKFIFNPYDITKSNVGYDILANCESTFEVKQMMEVLMMNGDSGYSKSGTSDKIDWVQRSLALVKAYAVWNFYTHKYPFDVLITNLMTKPLMPVQSAKGISITEEIMSSDIEEAKIELASFLKVTDAQATLSCIRDTINSTLQIFNETNVKKLCRKPTLNFKILREENCIFYIQVPERYARHYAPVTATLVQQLINKLLDNKEGNQIYLLFDEFCNIGKLSDIGNYLSTCRKFNISITACIQNLIQLKKIYGEIDGDELRELFKTIVFSGGLKDSAEYFSNMLGDTEVKENNITVKKPLMTASQIRQMKEGKVVIIAKNKKPVMDDMVA